MYDHLRQYRCTIIRGKSQKEMDDLLPAYALVVDEICPCPERDFKNLFNEAFRRFLPESERTEKTLDNHRTEISGKLFGMYYRSEDGVIYESQRTLKFLEDNDQPAFFKDVCYKMQFPNGMDSPRTLRLRMETEINIRPNAFVLKVLQLADRAGEDVTVKDVGYYVLNSLDVLQGKASPYEVLEAIAEDHALGLQREIKSFGKNGRPKASSYVMQHIREQLNYLELANLIRIVDGKVLLNHREMDAIDIFAREYNKKPEFDVYSYDLEKREVRRQFQYDWEAYFSRLSANADNFSTSPTAISSKQENALVAGEKPATANLTEFGEEGEAIVFEYEKARVAAFNRRLANKVLSLGKTKGIGYDIQSVVAEPGDEAEYVKYIEVKSTKRLTTPNLDDSSWVDTLNITRNEYVAANQHKKYYAIYRVFFTRDGVFIFVIDDVAKKITDGRIQATPKSYRIDYSSDSVDSKIQIGGDAIV